jgi:hypothetical protein
MDGWQLSTEFCCGRTSKGKLSSTNDNIFFTVDQMKSPDVFLRSSLVMILLARSEWLHVYKKASNADWIGTDSTVLEYAACRMRSMGKL